MTELIAVITITLLAIISPGPDFAMVTRNSLLQSRRAGVFTALGIGLGVLVHVAYTLVGVGLLIEQSPWLFNTLRLAGACYLIYLGVKMLRARAGGVAAAGMLAPLSDLAALRTTGAVPDGRAAAQVIDGIAYHWYATPPYVGNGLGRVKNIWAFLHQVWLDAPRIAQDFQPDVVIASSTY